MGAFVGLAGKALKAVLKIALFCGLAWFLIPFGVWLATELITGKYLEQVPVMNTVCNILWYMCYGFAPLTLILEMPKGICYNANRQERRKCSLWHAKSPGVATSGAFLFRCGKVAYALGWLPPIYLRPAICRCSRRLHLPRQRVRKTKIYSWWHTPFLYLYRGGSVAHYTIVAEMPQEAISPCLLSKP